MMEEMAKVISCDTDGWVKVEVKVKNACNHCENTESCGTSAVSKAFSPKVQEFSIQSDITYQPGDLIKLGLPESVILKAAALVYLMPLLGLFSGAGLVSLISALLELSAGDLFVIPGALSGAFLFWRLARSKARQMEATSQPVILSHLGHSI
ncbi:SoxR reducing system RseC family protein [uncultured Shewanella sp.]|uniref:SoxR reducing system RseC family protein n=1 Tax=uncultured Shewanella sp. TaxID=173975 RepID=UPI00261FF9EC|nr:SoxR reducing system RseC family protein [uncultured Shewanella sp.]